jgi:hypothetical protein
VEYSNLILFGADLLITGNLHCGIHSAEVRNVAVSTILTVFFIIVHSSIIELKTIYVLLYERMKNCYALL